jgi:hypothetical protein
MKNPAFARQPTTRNPQWSPNRARLDDYRCIASDALCSVLDECCAAGVELDLTRLIAAQDALDAHLDKYLDKVDPPTQDRTGADDVPQTPKEGMDVEHVEIWLRRTDGEADLIHTMGVTEFEAATDGEIWTRQSDGKKVFMGAEEVLRLC